MVPGSAAYNAAEAKTRCETAGDAAACEFIGTAYRKGEVVPTDPTLAEVFLSRACMANRAKACLEQAVLYGLTKRPAKAHPLVERACMGGILDACTVVAENFELGRGVPVNLPHAAMLFRDVCARGEGVACFQLGNMIWEGRGAERDSGQANEFFIRACDANVGAGCNNAGRYYAQRKVFPEHDRKRAFSFYERACLMDDAVGCANLASFYEVHHNDRGTALGYYDKSCKLGREESCPNAQRLHNKLGPKAVFPFPIPGIGSVHVVCSMERPWRKRLSKIARSCGWSAATKDSQCAATSLEPASSSGPPDVAVGAPASAEGSAEGTSRPPRRRPSRT